MWKLQLAGMAVALALCLRSLRSEPCRTLGDWAMFAFLVVVWVIPVVGWAIGTVDGLRERRRRAKPGDVVNTASSLVGEGPLATARAVRWETQLDPRTAHLAGLVDRTPWGDAEPPRDLGRFNCRGDYVFPPNRPLTGKTVDVVIVDDPGDPLPDGLTERDGVIWFECRSCGEWKPWPGEPAEFELGHPNNVCGGSPRCCP